ncbi:RadC family protein [Thiolinea disciformis]|uniref:RadC family protein n=1 Tax=Thiolinea disciformis TaxID=125614 RepID=UPI0004775460|nr:DNA repair protein RadC [Thiolinea disciformis]
MPIKDWPADERPREKLLLRGAQSLSDAELLAIFLRTGTRGKTAVDLARELLHDFNGLRALFEAEEAQFCQANGLGQAKFVQMQAVLEMSRRYLRERLKRGDVLSDPDAVRLYLLAKLRDQPAEVFACVFLDNRHRVIAFEELFFGTIDSASIYPREVVRRVMKHNAAAVIFAHNHPSGVAEPSQADERITQKLKDALALLDVRVLDHFVIGDQVVSFAERGLL